MKLVVCYETPLIFNIARRKNDEISGTLDPAISNIKSDKRFEQSCFFASKNARLKRVFSGKRENQRHRQLTCESTEPIGPTKSIASLSVRQQSVD